MLAKLRGSAEEVGSAEALRAEVLARIEPALEAHFRVLLDTQAAAEGREGLALLPDAMEALRSVDDARFWLDNRAHLERTSERAYEEYPQRFWRTLKPLAERRREQAGLARSSPFAFEQAERADYDALAPRVPPAQEAALRKSGHRTFLVAGDAVVALHDRGVRFVDPNGKPTSRNVPKEVSRVEHGAIADDGSFVLLRSSGHLVRIGVPDRSIALWTTPVATSSGGLCALRGGRFALVDDPAALSVRELRGGEPVEVAAATHPDLDSRAALGRVDVDGDLIFARSRTATGEPITLIARWDGTVLTWVGRMEAAFGLPRRTADGSVLLLGSKDTVARVRLAP